jgi:hypothetical protein
MVRGLPILIGKALRRAIKALVLRRFPHETTLWNLAFLA